MTIVATTSHSDVTDRATPTPRHPFGIGLVSTNATEATHALRDAASIISSRIARGDRITIDANSDTLHGVLLGDLDGEALTEHGAADFGEFIDIAPDITYLDFAAALVIDDTTPAAALATVQAMLALVDGTQGTPLGLNAVDDQGIDGITVEQADGGTAIYRVTTGA